MSTVYTPKRLPPQLRQSSTTRAMMLDVIVALLPALGMAAFFFGPRVLALCAVSVVSSVGFELLYRLLTRQSLSIGDLSACVTGLLLALSLPASTPFWVPVMGACFAIIVVKQFYGGLGRNFMNPALAGRMLAGTLPMLMTTWPQPMQRLSMTNPDAVSAATPMSYLHEGSLPPVSLDLMFLGRRGGCMGEISAFMLLLGLGYLLLRRVISARVPLSYLGTVAAIALLSAPAGVSPPVWTAYQLMGGGLLMGAIFFATDPTTSPVTPRGQVMYGVGCGLLTVLLRGSSPYPEGVGWAILTMNCTVWLLDRLGLPSELLPLMLVRPVSGSAALGVGAELISTYGPDSTLGRTAAVMLGSTETTFYTIAVYFGAVGISKTRYAVPAALCADLTGFLAAAWAVRVCFG